MSLQDLRKRVNQKVSQRHNEIIIGVYKQMVDSHNEFCGCNYCQILTSYVKLKRYKAIRLRQIEDSYYDSRIFAHERNEISRIQTEIHNLKVQKDSLKNL